MMTYEKIGMIGSWICTAIASVITDLTDVLGLTVIILHLILMVINTALPLYRKAKADGKITIDEVVDIAEEVTEVLEDTKNKLENEVNKDGNNNRKH